MKSREGGEDYVVDLRLRTLTMEQDGARWMKNCEIGSSSGTIGVDGSRTGIAAICLQWFEKWSGENNVAELAGHFTHEYMHILGFNHKRWLFNTRNWRNKTFVYKMSNLVAELIREKIKK